MSDPQPARLKERPARAEPLQPDNPGMGNDAQEATADSANGAPSKSSDRGEHSRNQSTDALRNVSEGYD